MAWHPREGVPSQTLFAKLAIQAQNLTLRLIILSLLMLLHIGYMKRNIRFAEPLVYGRYPKSMRKLVKERLPNFSKEEKSLIKASFDYLGINYYLSLFAQNMRKRPTGVLHHEVDSLALGVGVLQANDVKMPLAETLNDVHRIAYTLRHLNAIRKAIQ
ncbi:hypothetical protein FNV43_RR26497 [Rhamnella rubrinervis]|uniref:Beta-glucosidase n=1 Tax=Rhamnella rubrinervis TaxID=2594499 RepID=A0A8K0DN34_9ROSA|nr:hypothetical protein FNV43_RR26497 [Rhamnella rubrinervis]